MTKLFANSGDPDQMLHYVASDLGLYCLLITFLWVARLKQIDPNKAYHKFCISKRESVSNKVNLL